MNSRMNGKAQDDGPNRGAAAFRDGHVSGQRQEHRGKPKGVDDHEECGEGGRDDFRYGRIHDAFPLIGCLGFISC